MTEELKPLPCPFCGGHAAIEAGLTSFVDVEIVCQGCGANGGNYDCTDGMHGGDGFQLENEQTAIKAWNTRSPAWRDDMENVPDSNKRVMFWRSKLKRVIICRADDYWAKPRPHWFDDVTHWQIPLPPEETK